MKARRKITIMLMTMIIGTLGVSSQSARRGTTNEDNRRKASSTEVRRIEEAHTGRSANQSSQQITSRRVIAKEKTYRVPQQRKIKTVNYRSVPKTSTTTRYNPNSDYRVADRTVHVGNTYRDPGHENRTNSKRIEKVQSTNKHISRNKRHYTYYPHKRVKISVHPVTYRNHYRVAYYPSHRDIIWTRSMYRTYYSLYPAYTAWHYPIGYRVQTVSAFEAKYNMGEVSRVYGRVYATWYNRETDDLLLFFGGEFPNQEFTMVVPGRIARKYSWKPERYFLGQHVFATGLITSFEGKAEMVVKKKHQLDIY